METYHKTAQEYHMNRRLFPFAFGALQIGLVSASVYVLCSADMLTGASLFLPH